MGAQPLHGRDSVTDGPVPVQALDEAHPLLQRVVALDGRGDPEPPEDLGCHDDVAELGELCGSSLDVVADAEDLLQHDDARPVP